MEVVVFSTKDVCPMTMTDHWDRRISEAAVVFADFQRIQFEIWLKLVALWNLRHHHHRDLQKKKKKQN